MIVLLVQAALAQELPTIALLPLDAVPRTSSSDLSITVRGVAGAIQAEGGLVPVYDVDLASRLTRQEERLRAARDALAEGRRLIAEKDAEVALAFLQEAVDAHRDAESEVVRRGEAADAHYTLARALLATYDRDAARAEIRRAILLVPDYMTVRADAVNGEIAKLAAEAERSLVDRPPRRLTNDGAGALAADLGVDYLVHGAVMADGSLSLVVQQGTVALYEVRRPGPFAPPAVGDPWYDGIARQIVAAALREPVPIDPADTGPPDPGGEAVVTDPVAPPIDPPRRRGGWLVWTGAGAIAAGAAGAVVYVVSAPDPPAPEPSWTLTVNPP